jgi:hypothetical protein
LGLEGANADVGKTGGGLTKWARGGRGKDENQNQPAQPEAVRRKGADAGTGVGANRRVGHPRV